MLNYAIEPFVSDLKILDNLIIETYAFVETLSSEELIYIKKLAKASQIGASTRIENAQLTDIEVNWLDTLLENDDKLAAFENNRDFIENKLSKDRERSYEEVVGCRSMITAILEEAENLKPLRETDIKFLHATLLKPYSKAGPYVGTYKVQPNYVVSTNIRTNTSKIIFKTADAGPVTESHMYDLLQWYNQAIALSSWPITVACEFVFRFLAIHPFQDGNGRLGRGLFILSLLQANNKALKKIIPLIAIDRQIEKRKEEYYFTLNNCSNGVFKSDPKEYHMEYFLKFMIKSFKDALQDIPIYYQRFLNIKKLSDSAYIVFECFQNFPELRLNNKTIQEKTNLPRRTIAYCLNQLIEYKLIQKYGEGAGRKYQITF